MKRQSKSRLKMHPDGSNKTQAGLLCWADNRSMAPAPHGERCDVKEGIKNYYNQLEGERVKVVWSKVDWTHMCMEYCKVCGHINWIIDVYVALCEVVVVIMTKETLLAHLCIKNFLDLKNPDLPCQKLYLYSRLLHHCTFSAPLIFSLFLVAFAAAVELRKTQKRNH